MAQKTFFLTENLASSSNHLALQDGGSAPSETRMTTGWIVGTTSTSPTKYALMDSQTERASAALGATVLPDGSVPNNTLGDSFRSPNPLNGTFANASWNLKWEVLGESRATSTTDGRLKMRVWKGADPTGSDAVELTSGNQTTAQFVDLSNSTRIELNNNPVLPETTFTNEYLFVQVAFQYEGAGNNANADVHLCTGANCRILTSDFTPSGGGGPVEETVSADKSLAVVPVENADVFDDLSAGRVMDQNLTNYILVEETLYD